jgi:hypothetical protein
MASNTKRTALAFLLRARACPLLLIERMNQHGEGPAKLPERAAVGAHSFLAHFRRDLREAIGAGAALAALTMASGCAGESSSGQLANDTPAAEDSDDSPTAVPLATLEPYPLASIGCFGPMSESPLYGPQCCFEPNCYQPAASAACETNLESPQVLALLPPGSGTCGCQVLEEGRPFVSGPYAVNTDAEESSLEPGMCCYVVGSVGCTGRPFVIGGIGHLAGVAYRADWGLVA